MSHPPIPTESDSAPLHRLLVSCPDGPGIVAALTAFLRDEGANIVNSDQHSTDPRGGTFFMRIEFDLDLPEGDRASFEGRFGEVAERFEMRWRVSHRDRPKRIAVLVSREEHCLLGLLLRGRRGEIEGNVQFVASNHADLRDDVLSFGLPYHHIPVPKGEKRAAEQQLLELLAGRVDLVVLARYMQILSGEFLNEVGVPLINIHHSFLPAFPGSGPYQRAKDRGVKLIGATAHYVTEELDAGPIIEQDVIRVSHSDDVPALVRLGADIERSVLDRAVQRHCEDRVLVHENTTVVF